MHNAQQKFSWLLILGLCAAFPVIGKTFDDLRRSMTSLLRQPVHVTGAHQGEDRLPAGALAAIRLLRESGVSEYSVSHGVHETYDYQRITEGAWPIRLTEKALAEIFLVTEALPKNCAKQGQKDGMVIARCR